MQRNHFKERAEIRMAALGIVQKQLADKLSKPVQRLTEALRGDNTPAARSMRVEIDLTLTGMCNEKREQMAAEIEKVRAVQCPHLQGKISVILPEDTIYIVTEDGIPVGSWNPVTNTYSELDAALMPVVGRRAR
jgi:hypothetical protein